MKILFPPHPLGKIKPTTLPRHERTGRYIAQRKFNGTHIVLNVSPQREVGILTRHGTPPKLFRLSQGHIDQILSLDLEEGKEYWFDGELLDHKTTDRRYKGRLVLFDVLHAGKYLFRRPDQMARLALLSAICRHPQEREPGNGIALQVTEQVWLAEHWDSGFLDRYQDFLKTDEIEGLILREKKSVLDNFGRAEYDVPWLLRARKSHSGGNYGF